MHNKKSAFLLIAALICPVLLLSCTGENGDRIIKLTVPEQTGDHLVTLYVDTPEGSDAQLWKLIPADGGSTITGQRLTGKNSDRIAFLVNPSATDLESDYTLDEVRSEVSDVFSYEEIDGTFLSLKESGDPVLDYVFGMFLKEGVPEDRRRSNYFHPVYGLDGEIVTDDFPADHFHHRGLFFAWPTVVVDGDSLDLWHIDHITKRFERWLERESGPVFARFGLTNSWYTDKRKAVTETLHTTVYRAGKTGRIIDVELTLEALESDVLLAGSRDPKGYGGCNFRPAPFTGEVITTDMGEQDDSDLRRFPWADFSAVFEGASRRSGVSIFQDSGNLNTPNGWCLRHYGFLGVSWPGKNPYLLRVGKPLDLRFRVWIHRDNASEGGSATAYEAFTQPIRASYIQ